MDLQRYRHTHTGMYFHLLSSYLYQNYQCIQKLTQTVREEQSERRQPVSLQADYSHQSPVEEQSPGFSTNHPLPRQKALVQLILSEQQERPLFLPQNGQLHLSVSGRIKNKQLNQS